MASISSQYPNRSELNDQYKAQQAEKEEIKSQNETEIENLKRAYAEEKEGLKDRFETSLQSDKQKTYENLRNIKAQLNREERQMAAQKNESINNKKSQFLHEEIQTEQEGRQKLSEVKNKYVTAEDFERRKLLAAENQIRTDHKRSAEAILNNSQKKIETLKNEKEKFLESEKTTHAEALGQIQDHYQNLRGQTEEAYRGEISNLAAKATSDLDQRKLAVASYIKKYDNKQSDPFYQIKRFDSDLLDIGDSYLIRVKVPEYERKQFKVQVAGQEVQLSGVRSSDETVKLDSGREISSKSYQNISERYKLDSPVDGRALTFKTNGDWLEYTLPKFGPNHSLADRYRSPANYKELDPNAKEIEFIGTLPTPSISASVKDKGPIGNS